MTSSANVSRNNFFCIALALLCCEAFADTRSDCAPAGASRAVQVSYVHDGDTLWFKDNGKTSKLRIIGINTPEIKRRSRKGEPLAEYARDLLRQKVKHDTIQIALDKEAYDRYGRVLAHIFLPDGDNITAWLLEQGAGFAVAFPPNLKHADCYREAEQKARIAQRGVWKHHYFDVVPAEKVHRTGFMRVRGCVKKVKQRRNSLHLVLAPRFVVKIRKDNIEAYFQSWLSQIENDFAGLCLIVKGWVYKEQGSKKNVLELRHPYAVEIIDS